MSQNHPVDDYTIAIPHPDRDDLGRRLAASRCPSESGASLPEHGGVWP